MGRKKLGSLKRGTICALDTMIFIYFLEQHPAYYELLCDLFARIERGDLFGVMSSLVLTELLVPLYRTGRSKEAENLAELLTNFPNMEIVTLSSEIAMEAARIRARYKIRTPDAIHAATALKSRAQVLVTNDKHFLALTDEIEVILLRNLLPSVVA